MYIVVYLLKDTHTKEHRYNMYNTCNMCTKDNYLAASAMYNMFSPHLTSPLSWRQKYLVEAALLFMLL